MAIDDVVSDIENQVAGSATLTIRPATGDEWLVTGVFFENDGAIRAGGDTGNIQVGVFGGTTAKVINPAFWGVRPGHWFVTNAEYLTLLENTGVTRQIGFSAIKTKE